jgi:hypothetical protein
MEIRIRESGQVMFEDEFRRMNSNSMAMRLPQLTEEIINNHGGDVVLEGPQASNGTVYQYSMRNGVEEIDGKWYTKYILGPVFANQEDEDNYKDQKDKEKSANIRQIRNELISETDWTQGKDILNSVSSKYTTYRQALRDITTQTGFPWTIEWPTKPE